MKSLLEKLKEWKNETRQENSLSNLPQPSPTDGNKTAAGQNLSQPEDAFRWPAGPCDRGCGSVLAWRDVYGGGPHCHGCRPWPSWGIVRALAGYDAQASNWRVLWSAAGSGGQQAGSDASCGHSRTRSRTAWPVKDGVDRRTGKPILVADLDRVEEAEEFRECVFCGEWFSRSEI